MMIWTAVAEHHFGFQGDCETTVVGSALDYHRVVAAAIEFINQKGLPTRKIYSPSQVKRNKRTESVIEQETFSDDLIDTAGFFIPEDLQDGDALNTVAWSGERRVYVYFVHHEILGARDP